MVDLSKDKKSSTWVVTRTDNEGFHQQLYVTAKELRELLKLIVYKIYTL